MNKKLHRIVFNRRRGQWMAAAETVKGPGKEGMGPASHLAALVLILLLTGLAPALSLAQIRADPSAPAPQRATVLLAPNGVPLVNIRTPSAAGVSRNAYRQFDVDGRGAILNNSRTSAPSQLGGWVEGNPWLARGSARIVLNEVHSSDPSQLRGYVEVAGARAEVIIANPSGIQVEGAGFINASQVTLTTGTPRVKDGRVEGWLVQQGTVTVDGNGLDTRDADYTRIVTRALKLNAGLWGQDVRVITGVNHLGADADAAPRALPAPAGADPGAGAQAAPEVAIDVSQLGGMYAGKIRLLGTEAGVGVRQDGILSARAGDIIIDHQGWLSLGGHSQSTASVRIAAAGDITHGGLTVAGQTLALETGQHLLNTGRSAGQRLDIDVGSLANEGLGPKRGEIWQTGAQALEVQAGTVRNGAGGRVGAIAAPPPPTGDAASAGETGPARPPPAPAAGTPPVPAGAGDTSTAHGTAAPAPLPAGRLAVRDLLDNAGGTLGANGDTDLRVAEGLDNAGEWIARQVQVDGGRFDNREGALLQAKTLGIRVAEAANAGRVRIEGSAEVHVAAHLGNTGSWRAGQDLTVSARTLDNRGALRSGKTLALNAETVDNQAGGDIHAATTRLTVTQTLTNRGVIDGERTGVEAPYLRNLGTGRVFGDDIALAATTLLNDSETVGGVTTPATIAARRRLDIGARHITNREGALIFSAGSLRVGGALDANGHAVGEAETLDNTSATIESLGDMHLAARTLRNTNAHFASELRVVSGPTAMTLIQPGGSTVRIPVGNLYQAYWDRAWDYRYDTTPDPYDGVPPQLGATPIPPVGEARCADETDESTCARLPGADYRADDPAWVYFGLTPPAAEPAAPLLAEPVPPASPETTQQPDPAWDLYRTQRAAYDQAWQQHAADQAQWDAQTEQAYAQLDARIGAYNQQFQGASIREWTQYNVQRTLLESQVTRSAPGQILAGGSMDLAGQSILNDKSRIIAAGRLAGDLDTLRNTPAQGERVEQESGTTQSSWIYTKRGGKWRTGSKHSYRDFSSPSPYHPPDAITPLDLNVGEVREHQATGSQRKAPAASAPDLAGGPGGTPVLVSSSSLFKVNPDSTTGYLVETDPRFAAYRQWLGSDYLLRASGYDPAAMQKRLGDGFYEQRLVREQVAALTGHRFLGDGRDDEAQYQALMSAGATVARAQQLRPGIALSAAQVAQLTADIVWLVEQDVTLPGGRRTTALVPRVYLAPRQGDLAASGQLFGSVISGQEVQLRLGGDLDNAGSIAGRQLVRMDAAHIRNGGLVQGAALHASAQRDITLEGGRMQAQDLLSLRAGRDLRVASTTRHAQTRAGANRFSRTDIDRVAGLYVGGQGGVLVASAGRDVELQAAVVDNRGAGPTALVAGRDVTLSTLTTGSSQDIRWTANSDLRQSRSQEEGSRIRGGSDVIVQAAQDVRARAADVQAQGELAVTAGGSVTVEAGLASESLAESRESRSRGTFSRSTTVTRSSSSGTQAVASELGGQAISLRAGQDITLRGSSIVSDEGTALAAGRDVNVIAQDTHSSSSHFQQTTKSGLFSSGGLGVTLGTQAQSVDQQQGQVTAVASTVGSIGGDVRVTAGRTYTQVGSDVLAPGGDIDIAAQRVNLVEARERADERVEQRFRQSGLTLAVTSPVLSSLQTARDQLQAGGRTGSDRMRMLAGANALMNVDQAVGAVRAGQGDANGQVPTGRVDANGNAEMADANAADKAGGIGLSLSVGSSSSQSVQSSNAQTARGSRVAAGGDVRITASGAGADSDITVQGSDIRAGGLAALVAEDEVRLQAATETAEQRSSQSSRSGSVGVAIQLGNGGGGIGVTASASRGTGKGSGSGTEHVNTQVAGDQVVIASGGDTTLRGAVVTGRQVNAAVGGHLVVESLQDTDQYQARSAQVGGSVMIGAGGGGSLSAGRTRVDSDYRSVAEQSAIRAGDGGFQVAVAGDTTLTGGQITSTQTALEGGRNAFATGGALTTTDLENRASYAASAMSAGVGGGALPGQGVKGGLTGAGLGRESGQAASTTTAGISGVAGDASARTGERPSGLAKIFDAQAVKREIEAQVTITQEFGQQAGQAIKDYVGGQRQALRERGREARTPQERQAVEDQVAQVNMEERVLNILVGAVTGMGASAATKESLTFAAQQMRELMIEQSAKSPGVVDRGGVELTNLSGHSEGMDGDGKKLGGTRVDLDYLCGVGRKRCATNPDGSFDLDGKGRVVFLDGNLNDFLKSDDGKRMAGLTGGIQGDRGTLFGIEYGPGSWTDKLIEAFAGSHDFIGGHLTGLYDVKGEIKQGMSPSQRFVYDNVITVGAIPVAAPFAAAHRFPAEVWRAISVLLRAAK